MPRPRASDGVVGRRPENGAGGVGDSAEGRGDVVAEAARQRVPLVEGLEELNHDDPDGAEAGAAEFGDIGFPLADADATP